jgi:hypothetical protein
MTIRGLIGTWLSTLCRIYGSMPNIHEIVSHVLLLLDNRVSVDEFGDWMLLYTGDVVWESGADEATRQLAYAIQTYMTTFDTGHIGEETLRQELAKAIRPSSFPTV